MSGEIKFKENQVCWGKGPCESYQFDGNVTGVFIEKSNLVVMTENGEHVIYNYSDPGRFYVRLRNSEKTLTLKDQFQYIPPNHGLLVTEINRIFDNKLDNLRNSSDRLLLDDIRKEVNRVFQKAFLPRMIYNELMCKKLAKIIYNSESPEMF